MNLASETIKDEAERVHQKIKTLSENKTSSQESLEKARHPDIIPSTEAGLVGFALSGGGVRSATFNLGLLQSLAKNKVLHYCDYLSTVSGGGYIGSCLSSLLADAPEASTKKEEFPLSDQHDCEKECAEVNHLRATKNYLGLGGGLFSLDAWHMFGTTVSGFMLMNTIPLAFFIMTALVLYWIQGISDRIMWLAGTVAVTVAVVAFIWMVIIRLRQILPFFSNTYKSRVRLDNRLARRAAVAGFLIIFVLLLDFTFQWTEAWITQESTNILKIFAFLIIAFISIIVVGRFLSIYKKAWQKLIKITMSIALICLFLSSFAWFLSGLYAIEQSIEAYSLLWVIDSSDQGKLITPNGRYKIFQLSWYKGVSKVDTTKLEAMFALKGLGKFESSEMEKASEIEKEWFRVIKLIEYEGKINHEQLIEFIRKTQKEYRPFIRMVITCGVGIIIMILLLIGLFININRNSLHYFYRDRLSKTYLIKQGTQEEIEQNQSLLLKELHKYHNGPYHLVNATLNVPHSENPSLNGRGADFFIFSKYYCGAESTGYRCTNNYNQGKTELATAMAISGAAASPEMGTSTNPIMALLMTLLNIRLNLWMPNPNRKQPLKRTFWPSYLLKELFRRGTEKDALLNLSDGGHHENLGVYPLLKRRCRVIIASDAGADPQFKMDDLANLQRKARIDLRIEIDIDMAPLRPAKKNGYTQAYYVKGNIYYPKDKDGQEQMGTLFYIKTSLTGKEPSDLLAYQRNEPTFPDETTADQFFNEAQFESYRKLGELVGDEVSSKIEAEMN
jgi:hypothetical protein